MDIHLAAEGLDVKRFLLFAGHWVKYSAMFMRVCGDARAANGPASSAGAEGEWQLPNLGNIPDLVIGAFAVVDWML
jgi:hypothetical protein